MHKIPKYINKPLTFIGLELEEVALIVVATFYVYTAESWICFFLTTAAVFLFIRKKRKSPQGFYRHVLYFCGLYRLDHCPEYNQQEFLE